MDFLLYSSSRTHSSQIPPRHHMKINPGLTGVLFIWGTLAYRLLIKSIFVGLEAAHIRWHQFSGPDINENGLALCSIHHRLFERGALCNTRLIHLGSESSQWFRCRGMVS